MRNQDALGALRNTSLASGAWSCDEFAKARHLEMRSARFEITNPERRHNLSVALLEFHCRDPLVAQPTFWRTRAGWEQKERQLPQETLLLEQFNLSPTGAVVF